MSICLLNSLLMCSNAKLDKASFPLMLYRKMKKSTKIFRFNKKRTFLRCLLNKKSIIFMLTKLPLCCLNKGINALDNIRVPYKLTSNCCLIRRSVCHSNSPKIITPALLTKACNSKNEKQFNYFW